MGPKRPSRLAVVVLGVVSKRQELNVAMKVALKGMRSENVNTIEEQWSLCNMAAEVLGKPIRKHQDWFD